MKTCSRCKLGKPSEDFAKRSKNKDGLDYYCKECNRQTAKAWREDNKDKANAASNKSRSKLHWSVKLFRGSRSSADNRGLEHSITVEDILSLWAAQEGKCYWLGVPLSEDELPDRHPLKPSIDRLDNSKGYIKDNVVITSTFANLGRSNTTVEDFREFLIILGQQEKIYGNSSTNSSTSTK
uniref:Restriction endonuclease n=2 Tax=unclassified bacterial viruses TaxID=12333 RepID=A0AAU6VY36_9VIRU